MRNLNQKLVFSLDQLLELEVDIISFNQVENLYLKIIQI